MANLNTGEQDAHQGRLLLLGMNVSLGDGIPGFRALSELGIQVRLFLGGEEQKPSDLVITAEIIKTM